MKQTRSLAAMAAIALLLASPAFAQEHGPDATPPPPPHEGPGGHHGGFGGPLMEEADTNKDGFLTKDEMRAGQEKRLDEMFTNLDTDKDGKLSVEERQKGRERMRARMQERMKQHKENAGK